MATKQLNIGLVGYGFMGRAHSNAFLQAPRFFNLPYTPVLKAMCARNPDRARTFAATWGYQSVENDWRALVERPDIDLIDIASPNDTHAEIAIAAARAGKMVLCEKPLGRNGAEAKQMVDAVESAGVPNMVWYNYRRVPAVTLIKSMVDNGRLGRVFHYRAKFLQDWTISTDLPQGGEGLWRLDVAVAGSGVTGDLLAHCIDTAMWLNGPIAEVTAMTETFIKERKHNVSGRVRAGRHRRRERVSVPVPNGSLATFEATRYARGHKALYTLEINGEHGSAFWDLHDLHRLQLFDHQRRRRAARLEEHAHHRQRPSVHEAMVGPGTADRLRAHIHASVRRFSRSAWKWDAPQSRRSATVLRPISLPTRCCDRPEPGSGSRVRRLNGSTGGQERSGEFFKKVPS